MGYFFKLEIWKYNKTRSFSLNFLQRIIKILSHKWSQSKVSDKSLTSLQSKNFDHTFSFVSITNKKRDWNEYLFTPTP